MQNPIAEAMYKPWSKRLAAAAALKILLQLKQRPTTPDGIPTVMPMALNPKTLHLRFYHIGTSATRIGFWSTR